MTTEGIETRFWHKADDGSRPDGREWKLRASAR
jgi:hypothetical protein